MSEHQFLVPQDRLRPDFTVLGTKRFSNIGLVLEALVRLKSGKAVEIGQEAARLAASLGVSFRPDSSFSPQVTRNYLILARNKGLCEQGVGKIWKITHKAEGLIEGVSLSEEGTPPASGERGPDHDVYSRMKKIDDKGRIGLPTKYANQVFVLDEIADGVLVLRRVNLEVAPMPAKV